MYNLLVESQAGAWDGKLVLFDDDRFLEYTNSTLKERFKSLSAQAVRDLKELPAIFAYEGPMGIPARVGWIESIERSKNLVGRDQVGVTFAFENSIAPIEAQKLRRLDWQLDLGKAELFRTHWAVKEADLLQVLRNNDLAPITAKLNRPLQVREPDDRMHDPVRPLFSRGAVKKPGPAKIFIVHGHDIGVKQDVARFIEKLGHEPVILHERPNGGRTLITKFQEESADASFAVVLMTPDDMGGAKDGQQRPRARQNVIFELGFFIGQLGSPYVCALVSGEMEKPSDFDAVVYIQYGANTNWKSELARELSYAGIEIKADSLL